MATPKVCGIETEYGILQRGVADSNPIAASSILINAYVNEIHRRVSWDFEDEHPGNDARGFAREGSAPPEVETHLVNAVLTNGARYYVDHAHPEFSTPECRNARDAVLYDRAGERILIRSMDAAARNLPNGQGIVVHKNNSDGKGNSYGCHENYLMDRSVPFARIVQHVMPHFITRQLYCGAGKVGCEASTDEEVTYQLSQRADFFEEEVGLETTLKRPIVNTRDEPHADAQQYRRLHVIVGDANMSEVATYLKVGVTALILAMIEDDAFRDKDFTLAAPVHAIRQVSYDLSLKKPLELTSGGTMTALELQWELHDLARKHAAEHGFEAVGGEDIGRDVLARWEQALTGLESDPMSLATTIDWVAKYRIANARRERDGLAWNDSTLRLIDLQYHDLRPERSLAGRVGLDRITTDDEVERAVTEPPSDTRAYFRGKCLQKWSNVVTAANWDSLVFDLGEEPLKRIPMMEPLRGTEEIVGRLLEECASPGELIARLTS